MSRRHAVATDLAVHGDGVIRYVFPVSVYVAVVVVLTGNEFRGLLLVQITCANKERVLIRRADEPGLPSMPFEQFGHGWKALRGLLNLDILR